MKKITFLAFAFIGSLAFQAEAQDLILSQNTDDALVAGGVSCGGGDNQYYRAYDLTAEGVTFDDVLLLGAQFAVEAIDFDEELVVNAYEVGSFPSGFDSTAPPALLATGSVIVGVGATGTVVDVTFDTPATVSSSAIVVLQLHQETTGNMFFPGVTGDATADAYITSTTCAIEGNPTSYADIGFPDAHIVLNLIYNESLSVDDVALSQVSMFPNPATDVLNIKVPSSIELTGVTLYDVLGKSTNVAVSNGVVNVANLARGVYIVNIETTAGTLTEKLVIE
ncbi:hypothetical protein SCB49_03724 [unidentified eubacterium SCB49]|nr:hypothetical protein SCB49_03724 [unidentified eubacterium SCB49]